MRARRHPIPPKRAYEVSPGVKHFVVEWERFRNFEDACKPFGEKSCLYVLATQKDRRALYVGKASGLARRYSAALGALKALMSEAQVLLFVAPCDPAHLDVVEHTIIFWDCTSYNKRGTKTRPWPHVPVLHRFNNVGSWWGSGSAVESGAIYEGPLFLRPGDFRDGQTGAQW
jgi:hypothetical protein